MNLGAQIEASLPGLRAAAESLMTDRWRCSKGGGRVWDDVTDSWVDVPSELVYDGPGRLRDIDADSPRDETQGETTVRGNLRLSLPVATSGAVTVDDVLECVGSTQDASLVGTKVRVTDLHLQTHSTARRFSVEVESWPTT